MRALELGHAKGDDAEWLNASTVKSQIKRMNPSFNEKLLGFSSFTDFIRSRDDLAEVKTDGQNRFDPAEAGRRKQPRRAGERP